ncbi:helix-turn-helix transcriptional regulator [Streptomyces sp. NPDC001093]|uniref:helix-turn-helix transcriptional regulator n=1 Tax=Streptomyces sp. NPDC001093 TaxID=3154376 RepID=UPI0033192AB3
MGWSGRRRRRSWSYALLEQVSQDDLPSPAERRRLREAAGLTQTQIATALETRRETVVNWELGKTEPRPPQACRLRQAPGEAGRTLPRPRRGA